ncbi:hypothetical protein [Shewanella aestuarii]|uniref:Transporter substrate-binding domain-containing protein n=1 Tax=Shewanella aestuarii TaxID=1028752 RepID=A0A6G9QLZ0_9GAMM|nr:hypothetical protein [Shewanella aestuarii]QIR15600.1 hypothetical protein HBH39_14815 [Shewanella aestuarii]
MPIARLLMLFSYFVISISQLHAKSIDVIAVEFPPFTTTHEPDNGINFVQLRDYFKEQYQLTIQPQILPSARAQQTIAEGDWCLSFYPPADPKAYSFIKLSPEKVNLGFYRVKQDAPFLWSDLTELKGQSVAVLRYRQKGMLHNLLTQAGLTIVPVSSIEQGLKMLSYERVDLVFSSQKNAYLDSLPLAEQAQFQFSDSSLLEADVGVFVNPKCQPLLDAAKLQQ